jgi:ribonucleoside-diphosphate reductase alpha chain
LQSEGIAFEELAAQYVNNDIFSLLDKESLRASQFMAQEIGEPEWCKGYGVRNTHRIAIAPNTSSALLCGGVSQGIEPIVANVYNQPTSAGEMKRMNPNFFKLAKERGKHTARLEKDIIDNLGSVQHLTWLSEQEKLVLKTAYEIDQKVPCRLAGLRAKYIDQAQSLNLFFDADEQEEYIAEVHREAILNPGIKSLYYMRTMAGVQASKDCVACEG